MGGGAPGGSVGGGGGAQAPLTSPCPPSNHSITINRTLTRASTPQTVSCSSIPPRPSLPPRVYTAALPSRGKTCPADVEQCPRQPLPHPTAPQLHRTWGHGCG